MARIRDLKIRNFRSIYALDWAPSPGINCLIGPGDSGKSSILDAIDLCLGTRRTSVFGDMDFFAMNVENPIAISVTLGDLPASLLDIDVYGEFLRGFDHTTGAIEDEPRTDIETVITLLLRVGADLEPSWTLFSERAEQQQLERTLPWKERTALAPARIGSFTNTHLSWSRGSVLNRITEERAELGAELARAARQARTNFGNQAAVHLGQTLSVVQHTAQSLGVSVGAMPQALLDAHSVSIGEGAIALHSEAGIPLRSLGTGSSRLLVAGLQRAAASVAPIALVDEVEYGLEPHRLMRFLDSLGAKETVAPMQVFLTTHSPVALRELSGNQLFVVRACPDRHFALKAGDSNEVQSTLRADPEAFLAKSIIVCEGASEVGFARGLDQWWGRCGATSFLAHGGSYVNAGGGTPDNSLVRGTALLHLGYRVLVFVDADKLSTPGVAEAFLAAGGQILTWRPGRTLEDELFRSLSEQALDSLLAKAEEVVGAELMNQQIQSKSQGGVTLEAIQTDRLIDGYIPEHRELLGVASRIRNNGWFKSLTAYQEIARDIVGPTLPNAELGFKAVTDRLWEFTSAP
ncbi:chromosome segregation protein SMC [Pseudomonas syringae pv. syringae]|uniref:ATP-dependent nuclease n=1 Tax=Pseudomonas syringae TaxID=317 RepID=UPI0007AEDDCF|nr:ATP-binding protein [Pseudomonas syringae]KZL41509.1 chromosome segregation protein SMC [Pseudomonas syringae pv. syringae]PBP64216.1 ATP-dependent endonuclease [Pseudomonas syringae]